MKAPSHLVGQRTHFTQRAAACSQVGCNACFPSIFARQCCHCFCQLCHVCCCNLTLLLHMSTGGLQLFGSRHKAFLPHLCCRHTCLNGINYA